MNAQQINFTALANTARECAGIANSVSGTMAWIVRHWNLCCQQAGLLNFTTEARYTRRAALAADMLRMAEQLDNLASGCDALTGEKTLEQEVREVAAQAQLDEWANTHDSRKTAAEWIEIDHAEALKEDRAFNSAWQSVARYLDVSPLTDAQRARALAAAHLEALEHDERRTAAAVAAVPAANINDYPITTLHTAIDSEDGATYAQKRVTRAYVARSLSRALDSQQRYAEKYSAQDILWLVEHNADHAYRNSVISAAEFTELYHLIRKPDARPLAILAAMRDALLSGAPVLDAAQTA